MNGVDMELVACDFCGSNETVIVARQTDLLHQTTTEYFSIVRCVNCGLQFTCPRPTADEIGRYYSGNYSFHSAPTSLRRIVGALAERIANSPLANFAMLLPWLSKRFAMYVKPDIADPVREYYRCGGLGTMLDIGCGSGVNAHFWGEKGGVLSYSRITKVAGVEVAEGARESLRLKHIEVWSDIADVPADRRFGVIRMNWSLEHVYSPLRYFSFIRDRLEAGGCAVLTVPNYDGNIYRLAPACVELPIHLYHFRPVDIENYAARCGLKVVSLRTFSYPQMFVASAQAGLFPFAFSCQLGIGEARAMQSVLSNLDAARLGNDMLVILQRAG